MERFGIGRKSFAQRNTEKRANSTFVDLFNLNKESIPGIDNSTAINNALEAMGDKSAYVSETLKETAKNATGAISGITNVGNAAKSSSMGMQLLATAGNVALAMLISFGLSALDKYVLHAQDRLNEAVEDARKEYEESESTLQSLQSELDTTKSKIEELYRASNSGGLNIVEQEDLENLEREAGLLERQIELEERRRDLALTDTRKAAVESLNYDAAFQTYTASRYYTPDGKLYKDISYEVLPQAEDILGTDEILKYASAESDGVPTYGSSATDYEFDKFAQAKVLNAALKKAQEELVEAQDALIEAPSGLTKDELQALEDDVNDKQQKVDDIQRAAEDYINILDTALGDDGRIPDNGFLADWQLDYNSAHDLRDYLEDSIASMSDNEAESVFNLLQERYADEFNEVRKTVGNGVELTAEEFKRLWPEVAKAIEEREIDLEDAVEYLNDTFAKVSTPTTPTIPDASTLASSLYKTTEAYTAINDAIEEQASAGKISFDTMQELLKINPDFINALEKTADGYKISTDALMDYVEAQDLLEYTEAINAIANLYDELDRDDISDARRAEIQSEIQQYKMLVNEIENATGALSKYRAAKATENQDADFQEGATMYDEIKEAREIGKTGTDDFQTAVGFMLGEDWEQQYSDKEAAYKEAEKRAKRYFGQETESDNYVNFFDDLVKEGFATKENGQFIFGDISIEDIAEQMQMSVDAVRSLFMLAEAYGAKFEYDFKVDESDLEYSKVLLDELIERREELAAKQSQVEQGSEEYDRLQAQIDAYDRMIAAGQMTEDSSSNTIGSFDELIQRLATMKQYQSDLSDKGFDIPVEVSGDINGINGLLSNFESIEQENGSIKYSITIDENTTDEEIEKIKSSLEGSLENINSSNATQAVKDYATQIVDEANAALNSGVSFEIDIDTKTAELLAGSVSEATGAASELVATLGVDVDQNQLAAANDELNNLANEERIAHIGVTIDYLDGAGARLTTGDVGARLEYGGSLQNSVSPVHDSNFIGPIQQTTVDTAPSPDSGSQLIDEVQQQVDESGKNVEIDSRAEKYGLVQAVEDMLAGKSKSTTEAATNTSGYQGMAVAMDVPKQKLDVDVDAELSSDVGSQIAEEAQEQLDQEQVVVEVGAVVDSLDKSAQEMLSIAESAGVAQDKQENLKAATESLKTAFANLEAVDPYDMEGLQAASSEFYSAASNFQSAYNTLASDLQSIDPINVKANIASAQKSINSLNGKTVTINVKTNPVSVDVGGQTLTSNAKGTTHARNGMSLVDEEGAELIEHVSEGTYELGTNKGPRFTKLNEGDVVHTASETKKILSRMGSGIGGFFRDGLNNAKAIVGRAFAFSTVKYKNKNTGATTTVNRTTTTVSGSVSSNPGTSSSSSSSSSSKKKKSSSSSSKKKVKKLQDYLASLFDWIEVKLTRLQEQTDGWIAEAAEAIGYWAKNGKLDNALASISKQIKANTDGAARYLEQANAIAEQYEIPDDVVKLIQEGTIDITEYDDDKQEKIKAYQEWYDKAIACQTAVRDLKEQEKELIKQKLDNIIDHYEMRTKLYDSQIGALDAQLDYKKASGGRINILDYAFSLADSKKKAEEISKEMHDLTAEFTSMLASGDIVEGSEEYYEYLATISKLNESLAETNTSIIEIEDNIKKIDLTELQWVLSAIERSAASIQNSMNLHEAQGLDHVADDYASLIKNGMEQIEIWEKENEELREMQKGLDVNSEKYQEYQEQINANIDSIASMKVSQEQWNDAILDLDIKKIQDYRDELTKQNTAYQNQLNLQQSLENLEKAKSQRTQRVYREGVGFTYEADQDAIQDAQQAFDQELHNQTLSKLDEILEAIEDSKADTNVYDANGVLLGEQYTLPSIDYSTLLATAGKQSITDATMNDLKKAAAEMVLSGVTSSTGGTTLQIGDIVVQGVDNANALAEALIDEFPNAFLQALYSK